MTTEETADEPIVVTASNAAWSWWTCPRAVALEQKTYIGTAGSRFINVDVTDLEIRETVTYPVAPFGGNDHTSPAILVEAGKAAVVFYSRHAEDEYIRIRRGLQPVDASFGPLGSEQRIMAPRTGATYAVAHTIGDTIHLWFRCGAIFWGHSRSDDWGTTWSDPSLIFRGDDKLYCGFKQVHGGARIAMTAHPFWVGTQAVYVAKVDYEDGTVRSGSREVGNLSSPDPTEIRNLDKLVEPRNAYRSWVYDVAADGSVAWSSFDPDDMAGTGAYHVTGPSGTTTDVASTGKPFLDDGRNFYAGGAQFGHDSDILVSRHNGQLWLAERHAQSSTSVLAQEGPLGIPVRVWPVSNSPHITINMLSRYRDFTDFEGSIALVQDSRGERTSAARTDPSSP